MKRSCTSACQEHWRPFRRSHAARRAREIFFALEPRNPLKSLDSDERIQGNPRESNTLKSGFSQRNSQGQENPNGSAAEVAGPARQRARQLDPTAKRPGQAVRLDPARRLLPSPSRRRPFKRGVLVGASELANTDGRSLEVVEGRPIHLFRVDDDSELDQRLVRKR